MPAPTSHPLKRISTGSLSSLARSQDPSSSTSSASGLDFLQPALTDLADEAATLASNIHNMTTLHDALGVFNESFAGYLYALKMNAFCVEWPEAPDERSFARAPTLIPPPTPSFLTLTNSAYPQSQLTQSQSDQQAQAQAQAANDTYATIYSTQDQEEVGPSKGPGGRGKVPVGRGGAVGAGTGIRKPSAGVSKAGKGGGTIAERKKRDAAISAIIDTLPLEYRGAEPATRTAMEKVLTQLILHPEGRKIHDMVSLPDLPQARVNKCLIALVNKKAVGKQSLGGVAMYKLK